MKLIHNCLIAFTVFTFGTLTFALENPALNKAETLIRPPILRMTENGYRLIWNKNKIFEGDLLLKDSSGNSKKIKTERGNVNHSESGYYADFTDLIPGEKYSVKVPGFGKLNFKAPPAEDKTFTFAGIADHQTYKDITSQTFYLVKKEKPDCIVSAGDMLENGKVINWRANFFERISIFKGIPFAAAEGNNDTGSNLFASYLALENRWYSCLYGNTRFIFLDSNLPMRSDAEQILWLEETLKKNTSRWTVVIYHHSSYNSSEPDMSMLKNRAVISELFEKYKVNLVLNGHVHFYDRTQPINGVQYVTLPTMSGNLTSKVRVNEKSPYYAKTILGFRGYGLFTVENDSIKVIIKDMNGYVQDEFVIPYAE